MLDLRPTCEHCNRLLPPESPDAMICSFECTFCRECVENVLENVCPNCGGGFSPRPHRPATDLINGNFLGRFPAPTKVVNKPVNVERHRRFAQDIRHVPPQDR
ncbi:MAG: DUF1272 domain-containing protein [Pseudomonadota bacterium]